MYYRAKKTRSPNENMATSPRELRTVYFKNCRQAKASIITPHLILTKLEMLCRARSSKLYIPGIDFAKFFKIVMNTVFRKIKRHATCDKQRLLTIFKIARSKLNQKLCFEYVRDWEGLCVSF